MDCGLKLVIPCAFPCMQIQSKDKEERMKRNWLFNFVSYMWTCKINPSKGHVHCWGSNVKSKELRLVFNLKMQWAVAGEDFGHNTSVVNAFSQLELSNPSHLQVHIPILREKKRKKKKQLKQVLESQLYPIVTMIIQIPNSWPPHDQYHSHHCYHQSAFSGGK